jgi:hypothetical protein
MTYETNCTLPDQLLEQSIASGLDLVVRKQNKPIRPTRAEKATMAFLIAQLKEYTHRAHSLQAPDAKINNTFSFDLFQSD